MSMLYCIRFANDPKLENENVNAMVQPTFDMTFHNHGFRDNSTFASMEGSTFASREMIGQRWQGSINNLPGSR